jgi:hypothetical protein
LQAPRIFLVAAAGGFPRRLFVPAVSSGGRAYADPETIWLPGLGWSRVDRDLRTRFERFFSVPMIVIALLVLPFLAMEYFWLETVRAHFGLSLLLDIGTSVIWLAFALEVIVMVSVADKKVRYCLTNWIDLAVVFLPLVDFMPLLRLLRLAGLVELGQVSRLGRLYRLRCLLFKLWRTVLLLEIMQRFPKQLLLPQNPSPIRDLCNFWKRIRRTRIGQRAT